MSFSSFLQIFFPLPQWTIINQVIATRYPSISKTHTSLYSFVEPICRAWRWTSSILVWMCCLENKRDMVLFLPVKQKRQSNTCICKWMYRNATLINCHILLILNQSIHLKVNIYRCFMKYVIYP